ncbi:NAD(P)-dependent oxidoreductase [Streptomyces tateyamensis]|uniref:NAD(P)-dependent oxidoreductase n=1 Tax=Streptomyces tateyamensis TaxID=565073 RepID=A0A2V4P6F7_9ACTN|nr:SDR family oxidoreductase [Streptomyces tateyamensis]AXG25757.1 short-chain dehydrogenase [Streptomyces tateyamensis]PYC80228.1 NAD(P)-dependent oxidoreductase [Streptomyces tateyamensis]
MPGRALVTGAGTGIGSAIAVALAGAGWAVALLGRRPGPLAATARACDRFGHPVVELPADVTDPEQVRAAVGRFGPVDLLVNNAGTVDRDERPFWEADEEQWWHTYRTNVRGTVNLCRAVLPGMVAAGGGRVVGVNSVLALRPEPHYSAYGASKLALLGLTGMLAEPLRRHGVLLFEVSPGMVRTELTRGMAICADRTDWTPVERITGAVLRLAAGELDQLAGRFVHAGVDDLDRLPDRVAGPARTLRLAGFAPDDPLTALINS